MGDLALSPFFRELIERIKPDVIHFHHYHRVGVESIQQQGSGAPDAVICFTFHEMMAICMADGQMVKKNSRDIVERLLLFRATSVSQIFAQSLSHCGLPA